MYYFLIEGIFGAFFCATIANSENALFQQVFITVGFAITLIAVLVLLVVIIRQPANKNLELSFSVSRYSDTVKHTPCENS